VSVIISADVSACTADTCGSTWEPLPPAVTVASSALCGALAGDKFDTGLWQ